MGAGEHRCEYRQDRQQDHRHSRPARPVEQRTSAGRVAVRSAVTLKIHGELDLASVEEVRERLRHALRAGAVRVTADLGDVDFIDCAGLGLLLTCAREARAAGGDFTVGARSRAVEHLVRLTRAQLP